MVHKEISEVEATTEKNKLKEVRDIKKEERDRTVEDKESTRNLASDLKFPGFSEAGEQIRQEVRSAAEATDQHCDIERIERDHLTTDTAQTILDQAKSADEQGKEAVDKLKDEQEQEREEGEKDRNEQKAHKDSIEVEFNV